MNEIWKDIDGFEGEYQVSNLGRVKSLKNNKILSQSLTGSGYPKLTLTKNNKPYYKMVHRLVACAFLDNPNNYKEVNHINYDKSDNNLDNLEFCNRLQNIKHSIKNRTTMTPVIGYNIKNGYIITCNYLSEVSKYGFDFSNVRKVCIGNKKTSGGYKWFYKEPLNVIND